MATTSAAEVQKATAQQNADVIGTILTSPRVRLFTKSIFNSAVTPGQSVQVNPHRTGFLAGFWVKINYTVSNAGSAAVNALPMSAYKIVQGLSYTGFSSGSRHKTTGLELALLMQQRLGELLGTFAEPQVPAGVTTPIVSIPDSVAAAGSANAEIYFYVPIIDPASANLNGIDFGQYQSAEATLQLDIATNTEASNTDAFFGMYDGAVTLSNVNVEVFQSYYNGQLLTIKGQIVWPKLSMGNVYSILSSKIPLTYSAGQITRDLLDQDYLYRGYGLLWDNGGVFNPATGTNRDIESLGLYVDTDGIVEQFDPALLKGRNQAATKLGLSQDGYYFFNFGHKPIDASQNGQYNIGMTPKTVATGAYARRTLEVYRSLSV